LLPAGTEAFWGLLNADQAIHSNLDLDEAEALAERLAAAQPRCAALQATVAHLDTIRILQDPHPLDGRVDLALAAAQQALRLEPGYPRALRFAARLLSDEGHQVQALEELADGLRRHPHSMNLLFALDYAARTAGLMDIALGARARINEFWAGAPERPTAGFAYLYAGQIDAFEASFRPQPGTPLDGFTEFNLGYADLLRGHGGAAAPHFRAAEQDTATEAHFRALAKVFRFQIEGKTADAQAALDVLDRSRVGLQVPDGEFTFTMAEAAAFLGEEGRAMDLAERAFSQGFTCSSWYRASPFLARLQPLPRWRAILQHVDERRIRVAGEWRPEDFGL
jgi:tetratricopeptide (TPR) repeat protein